MPDDIERPTIVRTERGLSIAGTRITVYDILDYLIAGWPPHLLTHRLTLTAAQIQAATDYIATNRDSVMQEYAAVVADAEHEREYWETLNRERTAALAARPTPSNQQALRAKLHQWRERIGNDA